MTAWHVALVGATGIVGEEILRVILGFSLGELHRAFGGEHIRQQLAEQKQDQSAVDEMDADFLDA